MNTSSKTVIISLSHFGCFLAETKSIFPKPAINDSFLMTEEEFMHVSNITPLNSQNFKDEYPILKAIKFIVEEPKQ